MAPKGAESSASYEISSAYTEEEGVYTLLTIVNSSKGCICVPNFRKDSVYDCPFWDVKLVLENGIVLDYIETDSGVFHKTKQDIEINEGNHTCLNPGDSLRYNILFGEGIDSELIGQIDSICFNKTAPDNSKNRIKNTCRIDTISSTMCAKIKKRIK